MLTRCSVTFSIFLCISFLRLCSAVIYTLNATEYKKMPLVFHVDPYESCGGLYCSVEAALVADTASPLIDLITEYSAFTVGHYNHSLLRYNLCVPISCPQFHDNSSSELVQSLESCLNSSLQQRYSLKSKLVEQGVHCWRTDEPRALEPADWGMFAVMLGLLAVNALSTLYDVCCTDGKNTSVYFWTCFSIRRNWRKLKEPETLKCISFLRVISMMMLVMGHTYMSAIMYIDNTRLIEHLMKNIIVQFLTSSLILVQTFFIISGFLFTFSLEKKNERDSFEVNWWLIPREITRYYIRLTPLYALMLFYTLTLNKYVTTGPQWHLGLVERAACWRSWWKHLLYINNYDDQSNCMQHSWYLAANMQLFVLGLVIYVTCRSAGSRKVVLPLLMIVGVLLPIAHTYWQDLDGILLATPESTIRLFAGNPMFTHVYKRGHTNIFSYLAGMSAGLLVYHAQKVKYDVHKHRKYGVLFYCMFPVVAAAFLSGSVFFAEGPSLSLSLRMFFAGYQKPIWSLFIVLIIWSNIFKYEDVIRGLMEWRGWDIASKLCYSIYLVHLPVIQSVVSSNDNKHFTYTSMVQNICYVCVVTCLVSLPCWLLVEQPAKQVLTWWLHSQESSHRQETRQEIDLKEAKKISEEATHNHVSRVRSLT